MPRKTNRYDNDWYVSVLDAIEDLVLVKGKDSKLLWANKAFLDIYGMKQEELENIIDSEHSDPDDTLQYVRDDRYVYETKKLLQVNEAITHHSGEVIHYDTVKTPVFELDGSVIKTVGVSRLIRDKDKIILSDEDRASRKDYIAFQRHFFANLKVPSLFLNAQSDIVSASSGFLKLFDLNLEDLQGVAFEKIVDLGDVSIKLKNENIEIEKFSFSIGGKKFVGDLTITPWMIEAKSVGGHIVFFKDKTKEYKLRQLLDEERKRSIMVDKIQSLGELSAGVGHEINNPLAIVLGTIEKIKILQSQKKSDIDFIGALDVIEQSSNRIAKIIRGMKALSRDASADDFSPLGSKELVENTYALFEGRLRNHEIAFRFKGAKEFTLHCHPSEISQVLLNLVNNSVDEVKKMDEPWIEIRTDFDENFNYIHVSDSGNGIDSKIVDKIFTPFFTTKVLNEGTGLGLGISADIIKNHGGELYYNDTLPNTTFTARFKKT